MCQTLLWYSLTVTSLILTAAQGGVGSVISILEMRKLRKSRLPTRVR